MNIGMLWFDNDKKTDLSDKIKRAASYYKEKYGQNPNLCFVHPSMLKAHPPPRAASNCAPPALSYPTISGWASTRALEITERQR